MTALTLDRLAALRPLVRVLAGVGAALGIAALLVLASGKNPLVAYGSLAQGAFGSWDRVAVALNKVAQSQVSARTP